MPEAETSPAASPEESASTVPQDAAAPAEDVEPSAADEQAFEARRPASTPADDLKSESVAESNPVPAAALALSGVELEKPASLEVGAVLEAKAYTGSSYAPTYVDEGVVYTWKYAETASPSYNTKWTSIEGAAGSTFTVTDDYRGMCLSVSASAGANTVDFGYPYGYGPFKQAGAVDIYSASFLNGSATTNAFAVGDTVTV